MKIGEVSKRTGCNVETIRFYERIGIIEPPPRKGVYRDYSPADLEPLLFVRRARDIGFSLDEIRALLDLAPRPDKNCEQMKVIADQHLLNIRSKMSDLSRMEAVLSALVKECGTSSDDNCPLVKGLNGDGLILNSECRQADL